MNKHLVIVESPAKAKTIEKFLGSDFTVSSCYGHVRDLPKNDQAIDIDKQFQPVYEISAEKKSVITQLTNMAKKANTIYLASDDDREGEAISWHLKEAMHLDDAKVKRIVFREITKKAITQAIKSPRSINQHLVDAQQARRILDRLVGFKLSPVLWKKIKGGLSAGRVQSVAVRLIVEQERAIIVFSPQASFKISAAFILENGLPLLAELNEKCKMQSDALSFLTHCKNAQYTVQNLEKKNAQRTPPPPFITSTLQQEASSKWGMPVARTMSLAQSLYEQGKISYMRTDSVYLGKEAMEQAQARIIKNYGVRYSQERIYKTKSATAQEAHEAIRPTDFAQKIVSDNTHEQRLYSLIWKRALASQMAVAEIEKTTATVLISTVPQKLIAKGEIIRFDGYLKVYNEIEEGEEPVHHGLPPLKIGQVLNLDFLKARETFTRPPARYTEASLVKKLEALGIGRPSTYAPIISTIQKRNYVVKETREGQKRSYCVLLLKNNIITTQNLDEVVGTEKQKLFPTDTAMVVNDFLVNHFANITNYQFTAQIENQLDKIAQGTLIWHTMLKEFYQPFDKKIMATTNLERTACNTSRVLGKDPQSGETVIARLGRYGPIIQIGDTETTEKPRYIKLNKEQFIETITLEDALKLCKLPRSIGIFEEDIITINIGRFGPYIKHKNLFISLEKTDDPYTIEIEKAILRIQAKRKQDAEKEIKCFEENKAVQVLNGRWGPYIKYEKKNIKIPSNIDPHQLTLEDCMTLINTKQEKKQKKGSKKNDNKNR